MWEILWQIVILETVYPYSLPNLTPSLRRRTTYREVVATLPGGMAILFPLLILFNLVQRQSVEWHVVYAGATYALAALVLSWYLVWNDPEIVTNRCEQIFLHLSVQ
jgi:hypothetical protein